MTDTEQAYGSCRPLKVLTLMRTNPSFGLTLREAENSTVRYTRRCHGPRKQDNRSSWESITSAKRSFCIYSITCFGWCSCWYIHWIPNWWFNRCCCWSI